jgi:bis(5'-nucleosyl)-tetraphosphatase (symmetrical)
MTTYAIGDVQGCFAELQILLTQLKFNPEVDTLWFTGDLVNRGPQSLEVLRYVKRLGAKHKVVLGNHDLHLIAVAYGARKLHAGDTLDEVLSAPDSDELIYWLRHLPLFYRDKQSGCLLVHAGLAPTWSAAEARELAAEVEKVLHGETPEFFLQQMYGNEPNQWRDELSGIERLRCIINYFTRMRFCHADGSLDLSYKGEIAGKPDDLIPWFDVPDRKNANEKIIFGHWAALNGKTNSPFLCALDTGCVWGNCLTAMRVEDGERFSVKCG